MSPVPVLCAVQRPGEFDAHSIVLLEFGHVIPEYDEQDSHQYGDDEVDIHIRAQGSCIGKAAGHEGNNGHDPKYQGQRFLVDIFPLRVIERDADRKEVGHCEDTGKPEYGESLV